LLPGNYDIVTFQDREKTMITRKAIVAIVAVVLMGTQAFAAITIDGKFDPLEGYANQYSVTYQQKVDNTTWIDVSGDLTGTLYTFQSGTSLSVALVQSNGLVDNSYTVKGNTPIGWGKEHTLRNLVDSDKAKISIAGTVYEIDYLEKTKIDKDNISGYEYKASNVNSYGTSLGYNYFYGNGVDPYFKTGFKADEQSTSPVDVGSVHLTV